MFVEVFTGNKLLWKWTIN